MKKSLLFGLLFGLSLGGGYALSQTVGPVTTVNGQSSVAGAVPTAQLCQSRSYQRATGTSLTATTAVDITLVAYACNSIAASIDSNYYLSTAACSGSAATTTDQILPAKTTVFVYTARGETHLCLYPLANGEAYTAVGN